MKRLLFILEILFLSTFWWQTRFNLLRWRPDWAAPTSGIDYLIPFVYLADILFGLVLVIWLVSQAYSVKREAYRIGKKLSQVPLLAFTLDASRSTVLKKPIFWFGLLLFAALLSIVSNDVGSWGWYRWVKLLEGGLLAVWVAYRWKDERRRWWYGSVLLAGLGIESLLLILEWLRQSSLGWQWMGEWRYGISTPGIAKVIFNEQEYLRPMGTFAHANIVAAVLALSLPIGWLYWKAVRQQGGKVVSERLGKDRRLRIKWFLAQTSMPSTRYSALVWLGLVGIALLVTFSRSAWLIVVGFGIWYWWWKFRLSDRKEQRLIIRKKVWGWMLVGLVVVASISPLIIGRFWALATSDTWSLSLRNDLTVAGLQLWQTHPWLGIGLNTFTLHVQDYGLEWWRQPVHNSVLLILVEMGILGLVVMAGMLLSAVGWLFKLLWQRKGKVSAGEWALAGVWIGIGLLSMVDHYWWTSQQAFLAVCGLVGGTILLRTMRDETRVD